MSCPQQVRSATLSLSIKHDNAGEGLPSGREKARNSVIRYSYFQITEHPHYNACGCGRETLVKFAEILSSVSIPWLKKKE